MPIPITLSRLGGAGSRASPRTIASFYIVNGRYTTDAGDVRRAMSDLTRQTGYWCRIELAAGRLRDDAFHPFTDPDRVAQTAEQFLSAALPHILRCLPDME